MRSSSSKINQAGKSRFASVESLRALAALAVLAGHIAAYSAALTPGFTGSAADLGALERLAYGGGLGVFLFFALTGYLIFLPFAKQHFGGGQRIDLSTYGINRFLRLVPLYLVVVAVVLALQYPASIGTWARFLLMLENFDHGTAGRFIGPAWSLVVEVHFYLLLPLIAWATAKLTGHSPARAAVVFVAMAVVSVLLRQLMLYESDGPAPLWRFNIPANFMFFVPGMLLALIQVRFPGRLPRINGFVMRSDVWLLASIPLWLIVAMVSFRLDPLLCVASFLVIGACVLPLERGIGLRFLEWKPLAVIGIASYSLYLWHVPVLEAIADLEIVSLSAVPLTLVVVPLALAIAIVSYWVIERPFLRLRRQWAR